MSSAVIALRVVASVFAVALLIGSGLSSSVAPRRVHAQTTATSVPDEVGDTLIEMLARLPDRPLGLDGAMVTYADIARQTTALELGLGQNSSDEADQDQQRWLAAVMPLSLPQVTAHYWTLPEWRAAFGFDLFQVEQAVEYAAPPFGLTLLRGTFDPEELRAAWVRSGYQPINLGTGEAYAVRQDYEIDVSDPGSRMALGYLNVVALADDGTLVFSSTRDGVREALAAATGAVPSFADRADVAPLLRAAPPDLVSALLMDGEFLRFPPDLATALVSDESLEDFATRIAAEQVEARRLPPVTSVLLGQTAGIMAFGNGLPTPTAMPEPAATSPARLAVVLGMTSVKAAETAAAVIAERLATQRASSLFPREMAEQLWAEFFPEREVRAVPGEPAVQIELVPAPGISSFILQDMVIRRNPGFLAWEW